MPELNLITPAKQDFLVRAAFIINPTGIPAAAFKRAAEGVAALVPSVDLHSVSAGRAGHLLCLEAHMHAPHAEAVHQWLIHVGIEAETDEQEAVMVWADLLTPEDENPPAPEPTEATERITH